MSQQRLNVLVTDRESIERGFLVKSAYGLISIRDPDKRKVRVEDSPLLKAVLELAFHDAEPMEALRLPHNIRLISKEDAEKIWTFVLDLPETVKTTVVHCEQGMSRSPAVAAAICQGMGDDPSSFFQTYQPNGYVFNAVIEARKEITGR